MDELAYLASLINEEDVGALMAPLIHHGTTVVVVDVEG
jgi:hypothetical protein